jgi:hypothetical protein
MVDTRQRELAETVFERNQRREKEINNLEAGICTA